MQSLWGFLSQGPLGRQRSVSGGSYGEQLRVQAQGRPHAFPSSHVADHPVGTLSDGRPDQAGQCLTGGVPPDVGCYGKPAARRSCGSYRGGASRSPTSAPQRRHPRGRGSSSISPAIPRNAATGYPRKMSWRTIESGSGRTPACAKRCWPATRNPPTISTHVTIRRAGQERN